MTPAETPGWRATLAWRQQLAAYWSISWPAQLASFALATLLSIPLSLTEMQEHFTLIAAVESLSFFCVQALLTNRLVRKKYKTFRIEVLRDDPTQTAKLSLSESGRVWLWIFGPQLALVLASSLIVWWYSAALPPETVRSISSLSLWLRFLAVGPYAIGLALRAHYPGFRLQSYGMRYI